MGPLDDYFDYPRDQRPEVEVLVDGIWWPGKLRAWSRPANFGPWWGNVTYRSDQGRERVATVHMDRLRHAPPPPVENEPSDTAPA
jgi:hypothetical protein